MSSAAWTVVRTCIVDGCVGRFGDFFDNSRPAGVPTPPVPPNAAQRPEAEPVTDAERLAILKMLQDKKITLQDAEKLLAALDGK